MSSNRVSILYLTADNADADVVGSLMGIVREVQGGRSVESAAVALELPAPADAPPQLPPATKVRKPRALKAAPSPEAKVSKGADGRSNGSGPTVLAAMATGAVPDRNKLAKQIYGDTSNGSLTKVNHAIAYQVRTGKARKNNDGTYTVL